MRKPPVALVVALLASLGAFPTVTVPAASASTDTKIAIIVGATHGATAGYREDANEIYAEAITYSSNVVRVYSPNATASRVKAAIQGASIIVYLGHGNGWPSPYTYDPDYTTKDGFGLNFDLNGDGRTTDDENRYYGEPWIRTLEPAPNAVVLLFHLCYASGNSEPRHAEPSLSTAKKRVDNYAAAFLKAGARAVVASGHSHDPYYISGLFTTRQTIEEYWRGSPDANGNFASYPSERNPGLTFQLDPDRPGSYYRSIAGTMSLRTQDVTGAAYADTAADPATLVVPGNATPSAVAAPLYGSVEAAVSGAAPVATLATDVHVRVEAREWANAMADGSPVFRVTAGELAGWMTGGSLTPRDSLPPEVWEVDAGDGVFSPDGDGTQDAIAVSVGLSESAAWTLRVRDGDGDVVQRVDGESDTASMTWAPDAGTVPDGTYRWTLHATDGWGNGPVEDEGTVVVDTQRPEAVVAEPGGDVPQFSPNGDGSGDTVRFTVGSSEPGTAIATIGDGGGEVVDRVTATLGSSGATLTWDGRDEGGSHVPDGEYVVSITAKDRAGNRSAPQDRRVVVYGALGHAAGSAPVFFPQDGDTLGSRVTFSFRLRAAATVSWTVQDVNGAVRRTIRADAALDAGIHAFAWDGRDDHGAMVPRGIYRAVATATDGTWSATQRTTVVADAFRIVASDSTPGRGQRITITATSAEALDELPRLRVYQPGRTAWAVTMRKVAPRVYRATIRLTPSRTGTLRLRVAADDGRGRAQSSSLYLPLH